MDPALTPTDPAPPRAWPDPTPEMLRDLRFIAVWNAIKTWDIAVSGAYSGYMGANGNHVRAILDALDAPAPPAAQRGDGFTLYRRASIAELRPWHADYDMRHVSVSDVDRQAGSPKAGDMIARNPSDHNDQWLVSAAYFAANFAPMHTMQTKEYERLATIRDAVNDSMKAP